MSTILWYWNGMRTICIRCSWNLISIKNNKIYNERKNIILCIAYFQKISPFMAKNTLQKNIIINYYNNIK